MNKNHLIFLFLLLFLLNSCDSDKNCIIEPEPSETEIIAEKLQYLVDEKKIDMAFIYTYNYLENKWESIEGCNGFKIEDPFIEVCGVNYHLSKLVKFDVNGSLDLYFKY